MGVISLTQGIRTARGSNLRLRRLFIEIFELMAAKGNCSFIANAQSDFLQLYREVNAPKPS